ncbi:hypothetical protein SPKIRA_19000 [Sphingomonas paucimobilis]|nr:hypothetical protein SPKIRA_19000 [Sphingomonas paucimobilis]
MTSGLTTLWVKVRTTWSIGMGPRPPAPPPGEAPTTSIAIRRGSFNMTLRARFTGDRTG